MPRRGGPAAVAPVKVKVKELLVVVSRGRERDILQIFVLRADLAIRGVGLAGGVIGIERRHLLWAPSEARGHNTGGRASDLTAQQSVRATEARPCSKIKKKNQKRKSKKEIKINCATNALRMLTINENNLVRIWRQFLVDRK